MHSSAAPDAELLEPADDDLFEVRKPGGLPPRGVVGFEFNIEVRLLCNGDGSLGIDLIAVVDRTKVNPSEDEVLGDVISPWVSRACFDGGG